MLAGALAVAAAALLFAARDAPAVTTVSETHTFPCIPLGRDTCQGGLSVTLTPTCPPERKAIAGGFIFDATRIAVAVWESRRVGQRTWQVSGFEDDTRNFGDFTAFAYCARHPTKIKERTASADLTGPRGTLDTATAHCPRGTQVISGGWSGTPASYIGGTLLRQSARAPKRGWRVTAVRTNAAGVHPQFNAHAYCAETKALKTASGHASVLAPILGRLRNSGGIASPGCRVRRYASGGFQLSPYHSLLARLSELRLGAGGSWSTGVVTYRPPPGNILAGLPVVDWTLTAITYCG
jgi:hypothetical protein